LIISLPDHGNDVRTHKHDGDAKTPEFSFLNNWSIEKQHKFNNNDRESEFLALHADAAQYDPASDNDLESAVR
jgi:hypothetical protein